MSILDGKEFEGSIGTNNGAPIVKYSVDVDDHGILDVTVSASIKLDLLEEAKKLLEKTSVGKKVSEFFADMARKFELGQ
jgi:hypothetical protein